MREGFLVIAAGLAIGSFLNVLIDRLPKGEGVISGRSYCDHCKKTLRWYELIPVVSWVIQRGRCRRCHQPVSLQYPLVEVSTALLFLGVYRVFPQPGGGIEPVWVLQFVAWCAVAATVFVLVVADCKYQIIPDSMLVILLASVYATRIPFSFEAMLPAVITGMATGIGFYLIWLVTRGRGMGLGDAKLGFVLGTLLGFPAVIVGLYVAFLTGAFYGVILMMRGQAGMKSRVAFGPFLLFGGFVAYMWSDSILKWWGFL